MFEGEGVAFAVAVFDPGLVIADFGADDIAGNGEPFGGGERLMAVVLLGADGEIVGIHGGQGADLKAPLVDKMDADFFFGAGAEQGAGEAVIAENNQLADAAQGDDLHQLVWMGGRCGIWARGLFGGFRRRRR